MKNPVILTILFLALAMLYSCANKVAPTGGEKDLQPPVLLSSEPANYTVNFSGKKITLTFNEYVQLKDIQKQVMVSPPMVPPPEIELRKRSVVITIPDTLRSNTTYTINFGNSLSDFTEGNALPGFQYVFATGPELDSLILSGVIRDALTLKPIKDALAMIYESDTPDSLIGVVSPSYFARTNEVGLFTVRNIAKGTYRVTGLDDKNNNLTAEISEEAIGTGTDLVSLNDSAFIVIFLSKQPMRQNISVSRWEPPGRLVTVFARPVEKASWNFIGKPPEKVLAEYSSYKDTVILYGFPGIADSTQVIWYDQGLVIDTATYRPEKAALIAKTSASEKITAVTYPVHGSVMAPETEPFIRWAAPLKSMDSSRVKVLRDTMNFPVKLEFTDTLQVKTVFKSDWKEGSYEIIIPSGIVQDLYGRTNDTIRFSFSVQGDRTVGSIALKFASRSSGTILLQLVNEKDETVRQRKVSGNLESVFEKVEPGVYRMRLIYDTNNNDRWDSGDVRSRSFPEKVIYYKDPITVRSNWEVEVEWTE